MKCIHCGHEKLFMTDQQTTENGDAIVVYLCGRCKKLSTKEMNTSNLLDVREDEPTVFPKKESHDEASDTSGP